MILNNFLNSKRIELRSFGIDIQVGHGSIFDKFSEAQIQINKLSPTRRYRFKILKEQWKKDEMEKKRIQEERERAEQEANDERERKLKEILEKRNEMRAKLDEMDDMEGMDIQTMIDCPQKFKRIVRDCKANGSLFTDSQFPATAASCGDLSSKQVKEWRRPGPNCVLVEGEISPTDIKQGALGDCYFLSAMCVLGKARVEELFVDCFEDPKVGAYLIRFHKNDNPEYVIVDDFFPVGHNDNWAFCQTDSGTELWPMIIEKAYAKLHMGYDNIAAGKVQYALSDLTGGTPEEIRLAPQQDNPEPFWQKLMNFQASGYLMGAGSPEHPQGDSAVSEMGIVQGHAYAILDVRALDGEKLIQLKNPHGLHSVEWNGDWSDGDSKWTRKFKQELKQEEVDDGIFWMNLDDFIYEYKNLYICRIFNKTIWKALEPQNGEWKGDSAGGLPSKANPKATFSKNPQYIVTLKKPGNLFVRLTQNETIDMFKGQQPIIFMVVPTSSRIQDFSNTIGSSGSPTDLKTVSAEIDATGRSYPLKLNIMVASMNGGEKGEGTFGLHVHCTDMNSDIVPLK